MKTLSNFAIAALVFSLFFVSCSDQSDKETPQISDISGQLLNSSECKLNSKAALINARSATPDSLSCIEYVYNAQTKILNIKHINAGFNCCPDTISCNIAFNDGVIAIEETEAASLCNCNCIFDLEIEITGVEQQSYQLLFIEPYAADGEDISFEISLSEETSGSYCVTRKYYPWGMGVLK